MRTFTPEEAKFFYDKFGGRQDSQTFYEERALQALATNASLQDAQCVLEVGCGTGRFALDLLQHYLPATALYLGTDISSTMIKLAAERLGSFARRASVVLVQGGQTLPIMDGSVDRFVATYVFDLLSTLAQQQLVAEARRVLRPNGLLCLAGITNGVTPLSRLVMGVWQWLFAQNPRWVGGCRPSPISAYLPSTGWGIRFHTVVVSWGVASEVIIASPS